jgi:thioredoxin reductase (NADPH)
MGGDLMKTTDVDNFPGFPEGVMGPDLMMSMQAQAERFGAELMFDDAISVDLDGPVKRITVGNGDVIEAKAVVLSMGSEYRRLGLADEARLSGFGVSWCATCDGAFFRNKTVAVVGGGDSAMEEATFLTKFADKVLLIHRSDQFRASPAMLNRAKADPKIEFVTNAAVTGILGADTVAGITLSMTDGSTSTIDIDGLFIAVGSDPRTALVSGSVTLTDTGNVWVEGRSSRTSVPGVFAAGDLIDPTYRQAIVAAGSGAVAAMDAQHFLESAAH